MSKTSKAQGTQGSSDICNRQLWSESAACNRTYRTLQEHARYKPAADSDEALRKRMKDLAEQRKRFGYRRLHILLKREGLVENHKRTEQIYRQEKLSLCSHIIPLETL